MAHQCAAIPHTWCKKAVAESSSDMAVVSVPNLRSKAPTHHQVFWLMQLGAAGDLPKRPARLPAFSWGNAPQWPSFGAKPRSCKYSYGVSPGLSPGSFYPPPRSAAAQGTMIRCMLLYVLNTTPGSNCQCLFPSLPLFRDVHPKIRIERNPLRRQAPKGGGCGFWPAPG